jgi:hypothetical protein
MNDENLTASGRGRPKGSPNKTTKAVKDMILAALDEVGGEAYFIEQAEKNPTAFMQLISKVMPSQIQADLTSGGEALSLKVNFVRKALSGN